MRVTLAEQASVRLRAAADADAGCLTHSHALSLDAIGKRMSARLASWEGPSTLRIHQFVGAVRTGELELEILPKIDTLADTTKIRRSLLTMLGVAEDLDIKDSEIVGFHQRNEPILSALARLYCRRLVETLRRGVRQEYVALEETLSHIRGKVLWPQQARIHATQRLEFSCVFDDRSENTPINRTLKAALIRAGIMLEGFKADALVNELRHILAGVSDTPPSVEQIARLRTDRLNRHLEPLLTLAKLLLGNRNPDLGRSALGDHRSYAVVWDMNILFERYVGRMVQRTLSANGGAVQLQHCSTYLANDAESSRGAFLLRPDILFSKRGSRLWVADTKWKRLDPSDYTLGVSHADAYQLVSYAQRFQTRLAVLIYPQHPALGPPGLQRDFLVHGSAAGPLRLRIVTVDLGKLEALPEQLRAALPVDVAA